jgi:predicted ribosome quality control (RQC) complex YloA/Tae2 family protein
MNLEGITIHAITEYLQKNISGGIIYKVAMPTAASLVLQLKRTRDTVNLVIEVNGGAPAVYLPAKAPENPETPPAFCMLLRKHLEEGRITKVSQKGLDRIIELQIDILGSASKIITKKLVLELTGKNANIIFTENETIIDSLKHIGPTQNSFRTILPGEKYVNPPEQKGLPILGTVPDAIVTSIPDVVGKKQINQLITATTGIGKASAEQLFTLAKIPLATPILPDRDRQNLAQAIDSLQTSCQRGQDFEVYISRTNRCLTIFPYPVVHLEPGCRVEKFTDINEALNYAVKLEPIQLPDHDLLQKLVTGEMQKLEKKITALENDLAQADKAEAQRVIADTLMAGLYRLKRGQTACTLESIYDGTPLQITLSPVLSPSENAQAYYKKYNKYKRAQEEVARQLAETKALLSYVNSIDASLTTAATKQDVAEIKQELISTGLLEGNQKRRIPQTKAEPLQVRYSEDTVFYIGKNNKQNDYVTFSLGSGRDLWLHTKNIPGSHVLIKTSRSEPAPEAIKTAALLAAYFSKGRSGSNVPVDCTQRRYVKKPSGAKPGFVIFTHQTTYYVTPDLATVQKYIQL